MQVNVAFGGRRKMLRNSLQASQHDPAAISEALEELGLDVKVGQWLNCFGLPMVWLVEQLTEPTNPSLLMSTCIKRS